jgi:hypothetical protein
MTPIFLPGCARRIRDAIQGATNGLSVRWQMLTRADLTATGGTAALREDGKVLHARILAAAGARFETASAQLPEDGVNEPNPGFAFLQMNTSAPDSGQLTVEIELQPETAANKSESIPPARCTSASRKEAGRSDQSCRHLRCMSHGPSSTRQ